ncbi:MAG: hypothetical protein NUV84_00940 [Candidatus Uhrbacteria bacterium]|nr:hypothetical protein [Candidatus Uhrbacteria bacterium]
MSTQLGSELWNEGLKLVSFCPVCETRYNPMEARLLGEQEETHLLHVQCRKCQHSILAIVLVNQVGASSVGLLTDLSYDDVVRVKSGSWVSVDDVIEVHRLFQSTNWERELGRASQEKIHHVRERLEQREKKEQKNNATR